VVTETGRSGQEGGGEQLGTVLVAAAGGFLYLSTRPYEPLAEARGWFQKGVEQVHAMMFESARRALEKSVAIDPNYAPAHAYLAMAYGELDYSERAKESALRAATAAQASRVTKSDGLRILGWQHFAAHDYGLAQPFFAELVTRAGATERVAALLERGSGFNPEFTGRENVYLNAAILGLSTAEIDSRYGDIEAFAEIGEFINQPVKTYSSGMTVRLAFSVAIHVDPDVLLVDEPFSGVDAAAEQKNLNTLDVFRGGGGTVLLEPRVQDAGGGLWEVVRRLRLCFDEGGGLRFGSGGRRLQLGLVAGHAAFGLAQLPVQAGALALQLFDADGQLGGAPGIRREPLRALAQRREFRLRLAALLGRRLCLRAQQRQRARRCSRRHHPANQTRIHEFTSPTRRPRPGPILGPAASQSSRLAS